MRVGSLFSGIGGLDLGLERAGMTVVWQSENDAYASRVLAKHWPHVPNLGDITTIDWSTVEPVDLICGGYPCQPFSLAGIRAGENDARHLWPYFADAIRVLRPRWALLENVPGHLSMGFGRVLGDLAGLGYDTQWQCVTASSVGANHRRNRLFAVAHTHSGRRWECDPCEWGIPVTYASSDVSDTDLAGLERLGQLYAAPREEQVATHRWWSAEPDVGRVAHGIPSRVDRLKCLGNAVVPQVAEWVGHRIMEAAA